MRASSCVRRSSLFSIFSISLSPNNFFANCSAKHPESKVVALVTERLCLLSRPRPICFFETASIEINSNHDFRDNIRHQRVQRDLGIDMETFEEVSKVFEEFEEGVIARAHSISGLRSFEYQIDSTSEEGSHAR
jgi:hypothetical protein